MRGRAMIWVGFSQTLVAVVVAWLSFTARFGFISPRRSLPAASRYDEYGAFTFGWTSPPRWFSKRVTLFLTSRLFSS
jgi:hypothetical protein